MYYVIRQVYECYYDNYYHWQEKIDKFESIEEARSVADCFNTSASIEENFFVCEEKDLIEYCLEPDDCR